MSSKIELTDKVENTQRKFGEIKGFYYPVKVYDEYGTYQWAMFTESTIQDAIKRAEKNEEDIPKTLLERLFGWLEGIVRTYKLGDRYYYQNNDGSFASGVIIKKAKVYCFLKCDNGTEKKKSKKLLFQSEDDAKFYIINKANIHAVENFKLNLIELGNLFSEMLDKYPEKFI